MNDASGAKKDVYAIGKKNPNLPFHPAVRAGDFIFVSGQVAKDADGNMFAGNASHAVSKAAPIILSASGS